MAAVEDNILEAEWGDMADTALVLVCMDTLYDTYLLIRFQDGLFAAFLSGFLVFLIPRLEPNSADTTMDVLIHISKQLSNSTTPEFEPTAFQVSSNATAVNILFLLSLSLVLMDAFIAMLVKGALQGFARGSRKFTVPHLRAQERERRRQGLNNWLLLMFVSMLQPLIQGSIILFTLGIIVLFFPLHLPSAIMFLIIIVYCLMGYGVTIVSAMIKNYSPFSSKISHFLRRAGGMQEDHRNVRHV